MSISRSEFTAVVGWPAIFRLRSITRCEDAYNGKKLALSDRNSRRTLLNYLARFLHCCYCSLPYICNHLYCYNPFWIKWMVVIIQGRNSTCRVHFYATFTYFDDASPGCSAICVYEIFYKSISITYYICAIFFVTVLSPYRHGNTRVDDGSMGHGSWVKWVTKI